MNAIWQIIIVLLSKQTSHSGIRITPNLNSIHRFNAYPLRFEIVSYLGCLTVLNIFEIFVNTNLYYNLKYNRWI